MKRRLNGTVPYENDVKSLGKKLITLLKLTLYCSGGVQDRAGGEMVREGSEEPGQEAYDSLETDSLLFRGSSRWSRRRNGVRRR